MSDLFWARAAEAVNDFDGFMWEVSAAQFLAMYAVWFVLVFGMVRFLRQRGVKTPAIALVGLACYEIPAILRMTIFAPPYLHEWFFLVVMMLLGGAVFLRGIPRKKPHK